MPLFTFSFMNFFSRILRRPDNDLAMNLSLSINYNLKDMGFVISSQFLSILANSFCTGTQKLMYFSVFSPEKLNCYLNFSSSSFIIKF